MQLPGRVRSPAAGPEAAGSRLPAARPCSEQLLRRLGGRAARAAPVCRPGRAITAPQCHSPRPRAATGVAPSTTRSSSRLRNGRCTVQAGKGATDCNVQSVCIRLQQRRTSPGVPAPGDDGADRHRRCTPMVVSTDSGSVRVGNPFSLRAELGPGRAGSHGRRRRWRDDRGAAPRGSAAPPTPRGAVRLCERLWRP